MDARLHHAILTAWPSRQRSFASISHSGSACKLRPGQYTYTCRPDSQMRKQCFGRSNVNSDFSSGQTNSFQCFSAGTYLKLILPLSSRGGKKYRERGAGGPESLEKRGAGKCLLVLCRDTSHSVLEAFDQDGRNTVSEYRLRGLSLQSPCNFLDISAIFRWLALLKWHDVPIYSFQTKGVGKAISCHSVSRVSFWVTAIWSQQSSS